MNSYLKDLKNRIKTEPVILLKKPWVALFIPIITIYMVCNRLKNTETVVYLSVIRLDQLTEPKEQSSTSGIRYSIIEDYADFHSFVKKRINENPEAGDIFYNTVKKRFDKNDFAVVGTDPGGNPLSYVFICTRLAEIAPVRMTLPLPENTFGIYDAYTFEKARGKGIYSSLVRYAIGMMKAQGFKSMWFWIMKHNTVSVNIHYKLGISTIIKILTEKMRFGLISRKIEVVNMSFNELLEHD